MPSSAPAVSVLLPVRNGADHLDEALASVMAQTLEDFEVLAVDDGSTDATGDILEAWATRDARLRVLRQRPSGIVPALERARAAARGTYLARMDADDVSLPKRLEAQLDLVRADPAISACGCGVRYFPRTRVRDGARRYERWINAAVRPDDIERALFVECPLPHPTFFMRADRVAEVGGYRDPGWAEDYDLVLRLWMAGGRLGKVAEPLLRWREGAGRLSRRHPRYSAAAFRRCKAHYLSRTLLAGGRSAVVWGAGPVGKGLSRALAEVGASVEAFVDVDPRKVGQEIHGVPVLDPSEAVRREGPLHLAAVGKAGVRSQIRTLLEGAGMRALRDFVEAA